MDRTASLEKVYQAKNSTDVSWFEPASNQSSELILTAAGKKRNRLIDVGNTTQESYAIGGDEKKRGEALASCLYIRRRL